MNIRKELAVGDSIKCKGVIATIKEIISQDAYISRDDASKSEISIEFVDTKLNYRSWKSNIDGGTVLYSSYKKNSVSNALNKGLGEYYDNYTGRFIIPMNVLGLDMSIAILSLLENGFAMSAYDDGDVANYVLYDLVDDSKGFGKVSKTKGLLTKLLSECGVTYFTRVSLEDYANNSKVQKAIDYVLDKSYTNSVDGYCISAIVEDDYLVLVEVLEACI